MKSLFITFLFQLCLLTTYTAAAEAETETEPSWKMVKNRNGIQVYRAHNEDSKFKTFKAVTTLEIENIQSFVGLMLDAEGYKSWMHMLKTSEITGVDDAGPIEWAAEYSLPWPVKNRRIKVVYTIEQSDDYSIRINMEPPSTPAEKGQGYIVVPFAQGFYQVKTVPNSKMVEITGEVFVDPGGYVPAVLVNLITDDISYFTINKLRKYIQKDIYQNYETNLVERRPWIKEN